jgi:hypothetical protein
MERLDHRLELAVRGWGVWDVRARRAVERVDGRRLEYLTGLYQAMGVEGPGSWRNSSTWPSWEPGRNAVPPTPP